MLPADVNTALGFLHRSDVATVANDYMYSGAHRVPYKGHFTISLVRCPYWSRRNTSPHFPPLVLSKLKSTYIYMESLREIGWDGVDWIDLAQDRDQWRALVKTVMNLGVS
jgi:hypothetical protein